MRSLLDFIARFHAFFLFLLLQLLSMALIIRHHQYHNATFFNTANYFTGNAYTFVSDMKGYLQLKNSNEMLASENALLRAALPENIEAPPLFSDTSCKEELPFYVQYIAAKVINNSVTKANNYITLNKGKKDGVYLEAGVIGSDGIVGIVTDVSENFSIAMSLLHKKSNVSVRLKKSRYIGNLNWAGGSPEFVLVSGVPVNAMIDKNDTIVTSGFSSIFPENIPVGRIIELNNKTGSNFYDIKVELFTNFRTLDYVYVVNNYLKAEQDSLENRHEPDSK